VAGASSKTRTATKKATGKQALSRAPSASPGEYAREALSEWGKAARFGAAALVASGAGDKSKAKSEKPPLKERLNPATTEKGGRVGDAADNVLSRLGFLGKAASKLSLGSRAVDKVVPDAVTKLQPGGGGGGKAPRGKAPTKTDDGSEEHPPIPIQESIDLAVPIDSAFALAMRFEDFPQWSDRVERAEEIDDTQVAVDLKLRGGQRSIELEIADIQPPLRIEWEGTEGLDHGGMLTFHELAPSLTHLELSLDVEPEDEEELDDEPEDEEELEEEPEDEEELDEEPEDEADFEEEPEEEFEEDGDDFDEEGEPAGTR
jgi:uncharacterized membrane protein